MAEQFEDVLVIRVRRPGASHSADTPPMTRAEAEERGFELAAAQSLVVETAELAFVEELVEAWDLVGKVVLEVQRGLRNLAGEGREG